MRTLLFALVLSSMSIASAAEKSQRLLQFDKQTLAKQVKTSDDAQVEFAVVGQGPKSAMQVVCKAGATGYPGIVVTAPGVAWDLSGVGHVEVRVKNTGKSAIDLGLRVDNPGDWKQSPWNAEHVGIAPGAAATVRVCFGYSFGQPGYVLDAKRVSQVLVFVTGKAEEQSFRIETLTVGGKPGEKP